MAYLYILFECTSYIYKLYVLILCPSCGTSCKYYIVVCTGIIYQILCTSCVYLFTGTLWLFLRDRLRYSNRQLTIAN